MITSHTLAIVLFFGITLLRHRWTALLDAIDSYSWQPIRGTILNTQMEIVQSEEESIAKHRLRVTYQYHIGSKIYTSDTIHFGDDTYKEGDGSYGWFAQLRLIYAPGNTITAYYNPKQPDKAVLLKGVHSELLILSFLLFTFGLNLFFVWWYGV